MWVDGVYGALTKASRIFPLKVLTTSAITANAISDGVLLPRSSPIGIRIRAIYSLLNPPDLIKRVARLSEVLRDPITPI